MTTVGNTNFESDLTLTGIEKVNLHTTIATGATAAPG